MVEESHRKYLLRAITELKADVSRAVGQNVDLKEENQCLRCTIGDNKTRHERTMDRHRQARETSLKNVAAMRKRERELIDSESKLRSDTSSLRKENDDLRKKLNAQLDERSTLRREIEEKAQKAHDFRANILHKEMDLLRKELLTVRRDAEILQTKYDHAKVGVKREISANAMQETEVATLKGIIKRHFESRDSVSQVRKGCEDATRSIRLQVSKLQISEEALQAEVSDLRAGKVKAEKEKQNLSSIHHLELTKILSSHAVTEADKRTALNRIQILERESEALIAAEKKSMIDLEAATAKNIQMKNVVATKDSECQNKIKEIINDNKLYQDQLEDERNSLKFQIDDLRASLQEVKKTYKEKDTESIQTAYNSRRDTLHEKDLHNDYLQHRINSLQSENDNIVAENEMLTHDYQVAQMNFDVLRREKDIVAQQASASKKTLGLEKATSVSIKQDLVHAREALKAHIRDASNWREKVEDVTQQNAVLRAWFRRYEQDLLHCQQEQKSKVSGLRKELRKQERRTKEEMKLGKSYKKKALEAHYKVSRVKALSQPTHASSMAESKENAKILLR